MSRDRQSKRLAKSLKRGRRKHRESFAHEPDGCFRAPCLTRRDPVARWRLFETGSLF